MLGKQLLITRLLLCDGLNKCGSPLSEAVGFAMLICFDCHLIEQRNKQTERETDREKERERQTDLIVKEATVGIVWNQNK